MTATDAYFLKCALTIAEERRGFCAPNPSVGAVIATEAGIVATGRHERCGADHAEAAALEDARNRGLTDLSQATIYVTLEPCCHHGRRPPCTMAIERAGIRRVVYGYGDPNPLVSGKGAKWLSRQGIVTTPLYLPEICEFYKSYRDWTETKRPFVTFKMAISQNGKLAGHSGTPITISGEECRIFTMEQRRKSDAILTTIQTALHDNPRLNVRIGTQEIAKRVYLLDRRARTQETLKLFQTAEELIVIHSPNAPAERIAELQKMRARCTRADDLDETLSLIGSQGVHDLWVEGGATLLREMVKQQLIHRLILYVAPLQLPENFLGLFEGTFDTFLLNLGAKITTFHLGRDEVYDISFAP